MELQAATNKRDRSFRPTQLRRRRITKASSRRSSRGWSRPGVVENVERDQIVQSYKDRIVQYDVEIRAATQAGRDSRTIREMQLRRDGFDEELRKLREEKTVQYRNAIVSQAESGMKSTQDQVDTADKKIESLRSKLGDMAIAMSDYLSHTEELTLTAIRRQGSARPARYHLIANREEAGRLGPVPRDA